MNESDLARKITQHLDSGLELLKDDTLARLQSARKKALAAYDPKHQHSFGLAWVGHGGHHGHGHAGKSGRFQPLQRTWVLLAALIFGLLLVNYWQSYHQAGDPAEIDAYLLAEDLPVNAYLDNGFEAWLDDSAKQ
jgi:hypothetical protein